jgi:hypothetical protein
VSKLLRGVTAIEGLVLLVAGGGLYFLPDATRAIWPWPLTALNAAYLGAVYLAAVGPAALLVLKGRWSPARVVVPMILLFTVLVLAVSLFSLDRFGLDSPAKWLWLLLYAGIPANAAYYLWRSRRLAPADTHRFGPGWRAYLLAQALVLGTYGAVLLVAPEHNAAIWPWPLDDFHARLYSAAFFTPALGTLLLIRVAARDEALALGLAQMALGALPILAVAAVDSAARRVDWAAGGTWLWLGALSAVFLAGVGLARAGLTRAERDRSSVSRRPTGWRSRARLLVPARMVASLLGIAFIAAGVAGFAPALTPPPPADAPRLALSAHYGYLLGLFPVNAVHSLFHLGIGILGLLAGQRRTTARTYVRVFAVALGVLTIAGAVPPLNTLLGLAPIFGHDVWLHGVEAAAAGYVGFVMVDPGGRVPAVAPAAPGRGVIPLAGASTRRSTAYGGSPRAGMRPDNVRREEALSA